MMPGCYGMRKYRNAPKVWIFLAPSKASARDARGLKKMKNVTALFPSIFIRVCLTHVLTHVCLGFGHMPTGSAEDRTFDSDSMKKIASSQEQVP